MKYFMYIVSFLYAMSSFAQTEIYITKDVKSGDTDIQNAASLIQASNTIENNATAVYKTGEAILLSNDFFADGGSDVFMAIDENVTSSLSSKNEVALLNELDLSGNDFSVYPNPNDGVFSVQSTDTIISYAFKDFIGKQIITSKTGGNEFTIDITHFASGFYVLELEKENGEITRKKIIKN